MNCTLKVRTHSVGEIEVTGKVEKLGDLQKFLLKAAKHCKAVARILPAANTAKIETLSIGKS